MCNLEFKSLNARKNIVELIHTIGNNGAHVSPVLSIVEIVIVLFCDILKLKRKDFLTNNRNHFILSKGHGALAYYCAMYEAGIITKDELYSFDVDGGDYPGQPSKNLDKAIEYSSGTLGLGLSYACGLAMSKDAKAHNIYVLLGNGELNEGSVWESAMFAGFNKLNNITAIVDDNSMQADGYSNDILSFDIKKMWEACGWNVIECDGHNINDLKKAFDIKTSLPKVIIAKTIKGKGISFIEGRPEWHHNRITDEQYELAMNELYQQEIKNGN